MGKNILWQENNTLMMFIYVPQCFLLYINVLPPSLTVYTYSVKYPKLFALGGCAKPSIAEPYIGVPKIEAQAKTIAKNLEVVVKGTGKVPIKSFNGYKLTITVTR